MRKPRLSSLDPGIVRLIQALMPGLPQALERRYKTAILLVLSLGVSAGLLVAPIYNIKDTVFAEHPLKMLAAGATLLSITVLVSIATSRPIRPVTIRGRVAWSVVALAATGVAMAPAVAASWFVVPQINLVAETFVEVPRATPTPLPTPATAPVTTPVTAPEERSADRIENAPIAEPPTMPYPENVPAIIPGRVNILLLGGDAGPGRYGLRTDSMNLLSIEPTTGDIALIGIPRNLQGAPLPPGPLRDRFPQGFPDLINAVYQWGTNNARAVEGALGPSQDPGARLLISVVSELVGQPVDAFVLVDMQGFLELVDAVGGVDMYVDKFLPAPGNIPGAKHEVTDLQPGWHRFSGTDALSYARSRKADSDYSRMARQRCLMASIAAQTSTSEVLTRWPTISRVISDMVRTSMTPEQINLFVAFAGSDMAKARSLALTPPTVASSGWDPLQVRTLVAGLLRTGSLLDPTVTTSTTTSTTTSVPDVTTAPVDDAPGVTEPGATTSLPAQTTPETTTPPATTTTAAPALLPDPGTPLGARCQVRPPG